MKTFYNILAFELKDFPEYFAGNDGKIYSGKSGEMRCLKGRLGNQGYYQVGLCKNGKRYHKKVHRLIAKMFIPKSKGFSCVDHKNCDKTDNRIENLRWVSHRDNSRNQQIIAKNNTSGAQGVFFHKGNWVAQWYDNDGKRPMKCFSLKKHGDNAKTLAIAYRKEMVEKYYNRP